jgi:hypothetical protein
MADDGQVSDSGRLIARPLSGRAGYALLLSLGEANHESALTRTEDSQRRRTVRVCWNGSDCLASPFGST